MTAATMTGRAHRFCDDINTDYIISGRYKFKTLDHEELAKHVLEDIDPEFYDKLHSGDFVVAGENFGCGSSREQAPLALKWAGVGAILAKSFARIFYRNAINVGLPILITNTTQIRDGDTIVVNLEQGTIAITGRDLTLPTHRFPPEILEIIGAGGLVEYFRKYGRWHFAD